MSIIPSINVINANKSSMSISVNGNVIPPTEVINNSIDFNILNISQRQPLLINKYCIKGKNMVRVLCSDIQVIIF